MSNCVLCQAIFQPELNFEFIVSFRKICLPVTCSRCMQSFTPLLKKPHCPQCGRIQNKTHLCIDCQKWRNLYGKDVVVNSALFQYDNAMHDYFHDFKKQGNYRLRLVFESVISDYLSKNKFDAYLFVPTAKNHLSERRFDPVRALYGDLIKPTVTIGNRQGVEHQSLKNRYERLNSPQFFYLSKGVVKKLKKSTSILIFDDIYTTGATIYHMREAIRAQGITSEIKSLTLAR